MHSDESLVILKLQLLIARAAQKDSLSWWDDDSLTPAGMYLLERLFPNAPALAARKLALKAAHARHEAVIGHSLKVFHLFRLDGDGHAELELHTLSLDYSDVPVDPVLAAEVLEEKLSGIVQTPPLFQIVQERPGGQLEIKVKAARSSNVLLERAKALAWAYRQGDTGKPVYPYISE